MSVITEELRVIATVVQMAEALAKLKLKATKCKCVPLAGCLTPELVAATTAPLTAAEEAWALFEVAGMLTYLGTLMGPAATPELQSAEQLSLCRNRAGAIAKAGACHFLTIALYDCYALTGLGCKAQFFSMQRQWMQD